MGASANRRVSRGSGHIHRGVSNSSSSIEIIDTLLDFLVGFTHITIVEIVDLLAIFQFIEYVWLEDRSELFKKIDLFCEVHSAILNALHKAGDF